MATGKRAFEGKSQASLIAAILAAEPKPMRSLQPLAPPALERVVQTCLGKDPEERWQNAHDIMRELEWIAEAKSEPEETGQQRRLGRERLAWAVVGVFFVALTIVTLLHFRESPPERQLVRFSFSPWDRNLSGTMAVSPDGHYIAISGTERSLLSIRRLDSAEIQLLPGTEGAQWPFWSTDSRFIGFFSDGKLRTISVAGGPAQSVCDTSGGAGGAWSKSGTILFAQGLRGVLFSVPSTGGFPSPVTTLTGSIGAQETHRFPKFLPDGCRFLFLVGRAQEKSGIYVGSLDSKEQRRLLEDESMPEYVRPTASERKGYLLFVRGNTLLAQPFDWEELQTMDGTFPLAAEVSPLSQGGGYAHFSASQNGVLAYVTGSLQWTGKLLWFDREGKHIGTVGKPGTYGSVALSPDKKRIALTQISSPSTTDIWVHELARSSVSRFTYGPDYNFGGAWSPDGRRIAFSAFSLSSQRQGTGFSVFQKEANGAGQGELLVQGKGLTAVVDWSHDWRFIVYASFEEKTSFDLWLLPAIGDHQPKPLLQTEFNETQAQISPDGRWMAYTSDKSGAEEIYVLPFPESSGNKWKISNSGGWQPRWRGDGQELFYITPDGQLMTVAVRTGYSPAQFSAGAPQPLFQTSTLADPSSLYFCYDTTADGRRFLINNVPGGRGLAINVVVNWQAGLK
jgi:eukaryotic-like serine/threonine-protein kinase